MPPVPPRSRGRSRRFAGDCRVYLFEEPLMLFPEGVAIDGRTGAVTPETGRYVKRLSDLGGIYQDKAAFERAIAEGNDPIAYEVIDYRKRESDLSFGTTIMSPGKVGGEY